MSDHGVNFENFFGEKPIVADLRAEAGGAPLEIEADTLQLLFQIADFLERSAGSEAAVRLATQALKRALGFVVCVHD